MDAKVSNTNLVAYMINRLSPKYRHIVMNIRHRDSPPSFWMQDLYWYVKNNICSWMNKEMRLLPISTILLPQMLSKFKHLLKIITIMAVEEAITRVVMVVDITGVVEAEDNMAVDFIMVVETILMATVKSEDQGERRRMVGFKFTSPMIDPVNRVCYQTQVGSQMSLICLVLDPEINQPKILWPNNIISFLILLSLTTLNNKVSRFNRLVWSPRLIHKCSTRWL